MLRFLLLPMFLFLAACSQDFRWHQRLMMTLDTPYGPIVASVVQRVDVTYFPKWMRLDGTSRLTNLTGESLAVDLGGRRVLLSILDDGLMTERMFKDLGRRPEVFAGIEDQVGQPPRPVPDELLPLFVAFTDIGDLTTAVELRARDIPRVFGAEYGLREMTVEITEAPVTLGTVERILGPGFSARLDVLRQQRVADRIAGKADPENRAFSEEIGRWTFIRNFK